MKNFEKYIDVIEKIIVKNCGCNGLYKEVYSKECGVWEFFERNVRQEHCKKCVMYGLKDWLLEEYKEQIHLTHDEYVILKNIKSDKYHLISRENDGLLYLYGEKHFRNISFYSHLFKFIKWKEEPFEIAKLIADYEKENE